MHRQNKRLIILAGSILVLLLACCGCAGENKTVPVTTASASYQDLEVPLDLSGVLVPSQTVDVSSKISGKVISLGFTAGQTVNEGDILIQLDSESIRGQLMQAEASLKAARAAALAAENQAGLAEINLNKAQRTYEQMKTLFEAGAVSENQMNDTQASLDTAQTQYQNASGPALTQVQAAIDAAQANVMNLNIQLENATIRSPISGVLAARNIDVGEVLSPGVSVISIIDNSVLKLKTTINQETLALLTVGDQMDITIDGYPEKKWQGTVSCIGPLAVSTGEVFPLEITIDNDSNLIAGLSAHAFINTKTKGIIIPSSSIIQDQGESCVFVVKDQIANRRVIITGLSNDQATQILTGIDEGEQVAITNGHALVDKTPVEVQ